jgi:hypothetical protein
MKNIITSIFVTLGVIFLILIIIGSYLFITDPYNLKPILFGAAAPTQSTSAPVSNTPATKNTTATETPAQGEVAGGFELSSAQVDALISLGIDPAAVPSSISTEQEACFVGVLGEARVGEIKAGAVPGALEFMKAKPCI